MESSITFKVRLYPNKTQTDDLNQHCGASRSVYNWALQRWKQRYEDGLSTTAYSLANELVFLKKMDATSWLREIQAQSLQQALLNAEKAFKRFFSKKAGYPVFKKRGVRDSFRYPQFVTADTKRRKLKIPKIGEMSYRGQLPENVHIRNTTIVREGDGWYACIVTNREVKELEPTSLQCGVDMGVATLATVVDQGRSIQFTHHKGLDAIIKRINLLNERMMRKQRVDKVNSKNREKARCKLAKAHAKLANARRDSLHKLSTILVRKYGTIVVEDLKIKNMMKSASGTLEAPGTNVAQKRGLNRVIVKQAWGVFFNMLEYKCKWYGRTLIKVNPANTSRTCPSCNYIAKENRKSQAVFKCVKCDYTANADVVGATNVLSRGKLAQALTAT